MVNTLNSLLNRKDKNIELIFDQSEISFKTIIKNFENYKNSKFTFKIIPQNANFMIGSNDSNDRGEVLKI